MPIIIAYLQACDEDSFHNMKNGIKKYYRNLDFMPVIAKPIKCPNGMVIKQSGLNEIKKKQYLDLEIQLIQCLSFICKIKLFNLFVI